MLKFTDFNFLGQIWGKNGCGRHAGAKGSQKPTTEWTFWAKFHLKNLLKNSQAYYIHYPPFNRTRPCS